MPDASRHQPVKNRRDKMKTHVAADLSQRLIEIMRNLNDSIHFAQENCTEDEFNDFRYRIAKVMGELVLEGMNPLYLNNPEVKPMEYMDYL
jgi:hypothetical protein